MLPTIIHGGGVKDRQERVELIKEDLQANLIHLYPEKSSILISQVHDLIGSLATTATKPRLIWIEGAESLTTPAANALLKVLEEPPSSTYFFLTTPSARSILPTIASRCKVERVRGTRGVATSNLKLVKESLSMTPGQRIQLADTLGGKKEELLSWTSDTLLELQDSLRTQTNKNSLTILTKVGTLTHTLYEDLRGNVAAPLAIRHYFLSLPRVSR